MKVTLSASAGAARSRTSRTGPHVAVWQKAGVATSTAIGRPWVRALSRLMSCQGQGPSDLVQTGSTPALSPADGVTSAGIGWPGPRPGRASTIVSGALAFLPSAVTWAQTGPGGERSAWTVKYAGPGP